MSQQQTFLTGVPWYGMVFIAVALVGAGLRALAILYSKITPEPLSVLIVLSIGAASIVGGYFLTVRSDYELFPQPHQILGACINGVLLAAIIFAGLMILASGDVLAVPIILFLLTTLLCIEFFVLRVAQWGTVTIWQVIALAAIGISFYLLYQVLPGELLKPAAVFVVGGLAMELISRMTGTYLLSPWVGSFWNGWMLLIVSLLFLPFYSEMTIQEAAARVFTLPLWIGLVIMVFAVLILLLRLFKHKIRITKGYMQYKLQGWTLLAGIASLLLIGFQFEILAGLVALIIAVALIEGRLIAEG